VKLLSKLGQATALVAPYHQHSHECRAETRGKCSMLQDGIGWYDFHPPVTLKFTTGFSKALFMLNLQEVVSSISISQTELALMASVFNGIMLILQ
jgi:hypothetical protein